METNSSNCLIKNSRPLIAGLLACGSLAMMAHFISSHYGGPVMLYALLFGMALHFLSDIPRYQAGIQFTSRHVMHIGVALLGARMGMDTFLSLGLKPVLLVIIGVSLTIGFGIWLAKLLKQPFHFGLLTGGATAICGASAAMAISSLLPKNKDSERLTLFTVVGVTSLSTLCMVFYPLLAPIFQMADQTAGIMLGATIHDVAQVVGAGYMISDEAGDAATITKLMRVAMLVPVSLIIALSLKERAETDGKAKVNIPWFLWGFIGLAALASFHVVPQSISDAASDISRACLIMAIAAIGLKTSLGELRDFGTKPILLMVGETLFLLTLVITFLIIST